MAEAFRLAVAGKVDLDHRNPRGLGCSSGFELRRSARRATTPKRTVELPCVDWPKPFALRWPELPWPAVNDPAATCRASTAALQPPSPPQDGRASRAGPKTLSLFADLGQSRRRWLGQVPAPKVNVALLPAWTRATVPTQQFPKMEISQKGNRVNTLQSKLPQVITSSYELRFTRASRLRTCFDVTYNFREESFPKFGTYKKSNV